ncbi:cell wall protein [Fusarium austroafricanum]|uniref:Cell wall protein n=1 Tax=Fusarium austroafricanum TaxID=2364996 RepID=A0A8H4JFZ7_9HYPO|nr:cell wall protein [Fusarium austroafricanum]
MKLSVFTSVLLAGLVAAQQEKLPKCAQPCVDKYTTGGGVAGCGQLDIKCICSNKNFLSGIACCLDEKCDAQGKETAVKYAKQICSTAGVTDLPNEVKCDKSAASGTNSGASTPTSSAGSSQTSAAGSSGSSKGSAAAREGATGVLGVVMAMLFAL